MFQRYDYCFLFIILLFFFVWFHSFWNSFLSFLFLKWKKVMAVIRRTICKKGMESLSRGTTIIYYMSLFLYFWVLSTPVVSLVFGSYLYICINWFHIHFDEAFSSLRIANYKAFTRFHITKHGDLEVFTLAVDKVAIWLLMTFYECVKARIYKHNEFFSNLYWLSYPTNI